MPTRYWRQRTQQRLRQSALLMTVRNVQLSRRTARRKSAMTGALKPFQGLVRGRQRSGMVHADLKVYVCGDIVLTADEFNNVRSADGGCPSACSLSSTPIAAASQYFWTAPDWSNCSAACGGGTMTRAATCVNSITGESVLPHHCHYHISLTNITSSDCLACLFAKLR